MGSADRRLDGRELAWEGDLTWWRWWCGHQLQALEHTVQSLQCSGFHNCKELLSSGKQRWLHRTTLTPPAPSLSHAAHWIAGKGAGSLTPRGKCSHISTRLLSALTTTS